MLLGWMMLGRTWFEVEVEGQLGGLGSRGSDPLFGFEIDKHHEM